MIVKTQAAGGQEFCVVPGFPLFCGALRGDELAKEPNAIIIDVKGPPVDRETERSTGDVLSESADEAQLAVPRWSCRRKIDDDDGDEKSMAN